MAKEKTPEDIAKEKAEKAFKAALPPMGVQMAARLTDPHLCPMVDGVKPHVGGPITKSAGTVMIGMMLAAREMDVCTCVGPPDMIQKGSSSVKIENFPAARMGDPTAHGGMIIAGCPTVIIGDTGMGGAGSVQAKVMSACKANAVPLVQQCGQAASSPLIA